MPMEMPAFETPADSPLAAHRRRRAGRRGRTRPAAGRVDGRLRRRIRRPRLGVPVVVLGPGSVTTQAHRPDESVAIEELVVAARAYALTALRLLG